MSKVKKLGMVCEIVGGGTPKTSINKYWDGSLCWVTPKDLGRLKSFEISDTMRKISQEGLKNSSAKLLPIGSVILSSRAPIGYVVINEVVMATNQGCRSFICGPEIDNKYLYYFFTSNTEYLNSLGSGTTFKEISGSVLKEIEILCPSLKEQKRIVKILDETFEKIKKIKENTEKNLKNSKELFDSYLNNFFSNPTKDWEVKKLNEISIVIAGQSPEGKFYNKSGNGLPFYQGKKDFGEKLIKKPTVWTTQITKVAEEGDILMSVRAPVGPTNFANEKICIGRGLTAIRSGKTIDKNFLFYFFKMFEDQLVGNSGAVFNSINKTQIESIKIPLPSLAEQKVLVKKLEAFSEQTKKLGEIYKRKLVNLVELKKSILKKAFSGEL